MSSPHTTYLGLAAARRPGDDEIDVYGMTHVGKRRAINQDHFLICSLRRHIDVHATSLPDTARLEVNGDRLAFLAMVADGVGGGQGGEEASRIAVEQVTDYVTRSMRCFYSADPGDERAFAEALEEAAMQTHAGIVQEARAAERHGMATTLTLWLGIWPRAYLLQVGDSRCYLLRNGTLTQISRDQTMAQELIDRGVLKRTDPATSRWEHVLSSALGGSQTAPIVTRMDQVWGDVGLLCSDGLTRHVPDERIRERLMTMTSARQACEGLVEDALEGGGTDNVTVLVGRTVGR